jgi:hypothetical protein
MVYKSLFESVDPKMTSVELLTFNLHRSNVKNVSAGNVNYARGQDSNILFQGNDCFVMSSNRLPPIHMPRLLPVMNYS